MDRIARHIFIALSCILLPLCARGADPIPPELQGVGVEEKPGNVLPLEAVFTDEKGKPVQLGDYFKTGKPVVLQLGYFGCPMLCDQVSIGMIDTLKDLELTVGKDFSILYVSFDPKETYVDGYNKKKGFVAQYNRPDASADGWHMLVGDPRSIEAITDAVGFKYKWVASQQQYSHKGVIMIITPEGKVSRYLGPDQPGMRFDTGTMKLSLIEASEGKIGTIGDQFLLWCFHYADGKYSLAATRLMKTGGAMTVLVLGVILLRLFRKESRRSKNDGMAVQN